MMTETTNEEMMFQEGVEGYEADILDKLGNSLGVLPWWFISVSLHVVLLLMLTLIGLSKTPPQTPETVVTITFKDEEIPPYKQEAIRDIKKNTVVTTSEEEPVDVEIVDPVDIESEPESDDEEETSSIQGREDAFTNIEAGGWGTIDVMGTGGGGLASRIGHHIGGHGVGGRPGASKRTESAVDAALLWLARHQEADGHWDNIKYGGTKQSEDNAMIGLALLAFLGGGHTEKVGIFRKNVDAAVKWIVATQKPNGALGDGNGYNHAIMGLALCESAEMGRVKRTVFAAQKAVNYSVNVHQFGEGSRKMGWRYSPKSPGDMSVSGWFIMQLKSAASAQLKVPQEGVAGAISFLDSVEVKLDDNDPYGGHRYCYMAEPDNPSQSRPTARLTAIGILCRQFLGTSRDEVEGGVNFMIENGGLPTWGPGGESVDWYYWYYGTMVTFQMGGDYFKQWDNAMRDMLCDKQIKGGDNDGSWDPVGAWSSRGRVFSTAIGAMCLEVYYRFSPMYR